LHDALLRGLQPKFIRTLAGYATETEFKPGQLIFREGDPANRFYLIIHGEVALESSCPEKVAVRIQTLGRGEVLGWSWLFPPYYWHFDARVLEPTRLVFFYGTRLREHCETDHEFGYELMKRTADLVIPAPGQEPGQAPGRTPRLPAISPPPP
jgi:CRP-like cAMP-binding protein